MGASHSAVAVELSSSGYYGRSSVTVMLNTASTKLAVVVSKKVMNATPPSTPPRTFTGLENAGLKTVMFVTQLMVGGGSLSVSWYWPGPVLVYAENPRLLKKPSPGAMPLTRAAATIGAPSDAGPVDPVKPVVPVGPVGPVSPSRPS